MECLNLHWKIFSTPDLYSAIIIHWGQIVNLSPLDASREVWCLHQWLRYRSRQQSVSVSQIELMSSVPSAQKKTAKILPTCHLGHAWQDGMAHLTCANWFIPTKSVCQKKEFFGILQMENDLISFKWIEWGNIVRITYMKNYEFSGWCNSDHFPGWQLWSCTQEISRRGDWPAKKKRETFYGPRQSWCISVNLRSRCQKAKHCE